MSNAISLKYVDHFSSLCMKRLINLLVPRMTATNKELINQLRYQNKTLRCFVIVTALCRKQFSKKNLELFIFYSFFKFFPVPLSG